MHWSTELAIELASGELHTQDNITIDMQRKTRIFDDRTFIWLHLTSEPRLDEYGHVLTFKYFVFRPTVCFYSN